jgi:ATP-dependent RNA helicase DDX46/PRP5
VLGVQISREVKVFFKAMCLTCCAAYGGSGVKEQINELKRGVEAVVCTPGRMIDILVTSNGTITNLRRVTMLVIDEADRMFDMGFEPQINRIVAQIRPGRQTVLFSATFPRQVEILARAVLTNPVEIQARLCTCSVTARPVPLWPHSCASGKGAHPGCTARVLCGAPALSA